MTLLRLDWKFDLGNEWRMVTFGRRGVEGRKQLATFCSSPRELRLAAFANPASGPPMDLHGHICRLTAKTPAASQANAGRLVCLGVQTPRGNEGSCLHSGTWGRPQDRLWLSSGQDPGGRGPAGRHAAQPCSGHSQSLQTSAFPSVAPHRLGHVRWGIPRVLL